MQHKQYCTPLAPLQSQKDIESLVQQSLLGDWVLRIEFAAASEQSYFQWQQWGKALFALKDAAPLMDAIKACHASHPTRSIRLNAEKIRPETRLIFWVYDHQTEQSNLSCATTETSTIVADTSLVARTNSTKHAIWHYVAIIGSLLGSIVLLEETLG